MIPCNGLQVTIMKEVTRVSLNLLSGASFVDSDPERLDPTWDLDRENINSAELIFSPTFRG